MRSALHKKFLPPFKGGSLDPLLVGLESYWALDELYGTRFDSVGSNDLTDNNTVGMINDGPRGVNAKFTAANSESLTKASGIIDSSGDFTVVIWAKINSVGIVQQSLFDAGPGASDIGMFVLENPAGTFKLYNWRGGGLDTIDIGDVTNKWVMYVYKFIKSTDTSYIKAIGSPNNNNVWSAGLVNAFGASTYFSLGRVDTYGRYYDGLMGRVGVWSRALSDPDIMALLRAGQGKAYSDLGPPEKVNLVSYWNLDEVSVGSGAVTRNDSHGTNHLTDNNTVTSLNTGPESVVANLVKASTEYLSLPSDVSPSGSWSWAGWVNTIATSDQTIFSRVGAAWPNDTNGIVYITTSAGQTFFQGFVGDGAGIVAVDSAHTLQINTWYHLAITYDVSDKKFRIYVDAANPTVSAALAGNLYSANTPLLIGQYSAVGSFDGKIALAGYWTGRALSQSDILYLFNSGVGKKYSELSAGIKTNLVSYWNLTELSGNRADSHGANTLTDNNTVMSIINMPDVADKIAAKFVAVNSEYLEHADNASLRQSAEMTWAFWFKTATLADYQLFIGKDSGAAPNREYAVYVSPAGMIYIEVYWNAVDTLTGAVVVSDNNWHLMIFWVTAAGKINYSIDDGVTITSPGVLVGAPNNGLAAFRIGGHIVGYPNNGLIDEVMFWKNRVLTPAERTRLFNLGKGVFYPTFT